MNKKLPFEFFIVIAEHRSGSSLLRSALAAQKNILFYSMDHLQKKILNLGETSDYKKLKKKINHGASGKLIVNLAYSLLSKIKGDKKLFGFKCHPHRVLGILDYFKLIHSQNARIILLTRKNTLLRFISLKTIQHIDNASSKYTNIESHKIFKLNPININYNEYIKFKSLAKKEQEQISLNINEYNLPHIHITYEELTENFDQCFNKIFDFLDLDKNSIVNVKGKDGLICNHKKINVYKLKDKIINYQEFKKTAEDNNDIETLNFLTETNDNDNL